MNKVITSFAMVANANDRLSIVLGARKH